MSDFKKELEKLLNRYSKENESDTPDFILAEYILNCLNNFNAAVNMRENWHGREQKPPYKPEKEVVKTDKEAK